MNQQPRISAEESVSLPRLRRAPRIAQSALFGILFVTAIILLVLGTLFALSRNPEQTAQSYPILLFNKRRQSAPLLHRRFVTIFSLAALTPAIVVGAFSTSLISQNINDLFGENVRSNMESAREILDGYVKQELTELATDARAVENELNRRPQKITSRISYTADLQIISRVRDLDEAVFDGMKPNEIAFIQRDDIDYLIALTKLDAYDDVYLYVGRALRSNNRVLSSLSGIANASQAIDEFNTDQSLMSRIFLLTFIETALLILFAAVWLGLSMANRIIGARCLIWAVPLIV